MPGLTLEDLQKAAPTAQQRSKGTLTLEDLQKAYGGEDNEVSAAIRYTTNAFRTFGKDLETGLYRSVAGLDNTTANLFSVLDLAADAIAERTGTDKGGAFTKLENYYRKEAGVWDAKAQEAQGGRDAITNKLTQILGQLPVGLATAGAAAAIGGPVGGFAGLGALEAAHEGPVEMAKGAVTGGTVGKAFTLARPIASALGRGGFVGSTAATMESAMGATPEEALLGGAVTGALAGVVGGPPKPITSLVREGKAGARVEAARANLKERKAQQEAKEAEADKAPLVEFKAIDPAKAATEWDIDNPHAIKLAPDKAVNLNLKRIKGTNEFKQIEAELINHFKENIDEAGRKKVSHDQTEAAGRDLGLTMEQLIAGNKGQAYNAAEITARRVMLQSISKQFIDTAKKIRFGEATENERIHFEETLMPLFARSAEVVLGGSAEIGRALSAHRIKVGPSTKQIRKMQEAIGEYEPASGTKPMDWFLDKVLEMETLAQASRFTKEMQKATTGDMVMEAWINSLLSGPPTHMVNLLSNQLVASWTIPQTYVSGAIGTLHSGLNIARGRPTPERVFLSEGNARLFGLVQGMNDGFRLAAKALRTGEPSDVFSKVEVPRHRAIASENTELTGQAAKAFDVFGELVRIPGRALVAGDEFYKAVGYRQELNARAVRQAKMEGLTGSRYRQRVAEIINDPSEVIKAHALHNARVQTFTNPLGPMGKNVIQFTNHHPAAKVNAPFVRTPTNIFKFAMKQTPLSWMLTETRANIRKGGADMHTEMGKIAFGTGVAMWAANQTVEGNITGGGPANPDMRRLWYQNNRPYSFRIPASKADWIERYTDVKFDDRAEATGDAFVSYARFEPIGTILGISADWADISGHASEEEAKEINARIIMSFRRNIENKTFIQGPAAIAAATQDETGYAASKLMERLAGSVVPTGVAQWTRATDPVLREVDGMMDKIKSRLPEYSQTLPARLNVWGEPIVLDGGLGSDFVSPLYSARIVPDKTSQEAYRLRAVLRPSDKKFMGMELTKEEVHLIRQITGRRAKIGSDRFVESPIYNKLPDIERKRYLQEIYAEARWTAETELLTTILEEQPGRFKKPALKIVEELRKRPTNVPKTGTVGEFRRAGGTFEELLKQEGLE